MGVTLGGREERRDGVRRSGKQLDKAAEVDQSGSGGRETGESIRIRRASQGIPSGPSTGSNSRAEA